MVQRLIKSIDDLIEFTPRSNASNDNNFSNIFMFPRKKAKSYDLPDLKRYVTGGLTNLNKGREFLKSSELADASNDSERISKTILSNKLQSLTRIYFSSNKTRNYEPAIENLFRNINSYVTCLDNPQTILNPNNSYHEQLLKSRMYDSFSQKGYIFVPPGINIQNLPQNVIGYGTHGLASLSGKFIGIRDNANHDEFYEILFHEATHIAHWDWTEDKVRQYVVQMLGDKAKIHQSLSRIN